MVLVLHLSPNIQMTWMKFELIPCKVEALLGAFKRQVHLEETRGMKTSLLFKFFQRLFLAYPLKPINPKNPYSGLSTEEYGLWGVLLYQLSLLVFLMLLCQDWSLSQKEPNSAELSKRVTEVGYWKSGMMVIIIDSWCEYTWQSSQNFWCVVLMNLEWENIELMIPSYCHNQHHCTKSKGLGGNT